MDSGEALIVTVGCAAGAGAVEGGVAATCFLQPAKAPSRATPAINNLLRRKRTFIDTLLQRARAGCNDLHRNTRNRRISCKLKQRTYASARRPAGRRIVALKRQLPLHAAIGQHRPYLVGAGASRFKNDVAAVRRPARTLILAAVAGQLRQLMAHNVHDVDIVIAVGTLPAKC